MPVSYGGAGFSVGGAAVRIPTGLTATDHLLLAVQSTSSAGGYRPDETGWTRLSQHDGSGTSAAVLSVDLWTKPALVADGGRTVPIIIPAGLTTVETASVMVLRNVSKPLTQVIATAHASAAAATPVAFPAVTPTGAGSYVPLHLLFASTTEATTGAVLAGTTEQVEQYQSETGFAGFHLFVAGIGPGRLDGTPSGAATWATTSERSWAITVAVSENQPPTAPTLLFPVGNQSVDRTSVVRFRWQPNDPDGGDSQSKYDLRYRPVTSPAAAFTTVSGQTPNAFHDFAAATFAAGQHEWQVRTYDAQGLVGPFSASEFFTAATPPPGPVWTDPVSGQVIGLRTYTATYSAPDQVARQTRIVADSAGAPDEATVLYGSDSGRVVTTSRSVAFTFPVNSVRVHLQVRVENGGLWGPWATVPVQVSYTRPPTPSLTLSAGAASIIVAPSVPAPTNGQPAVAYLDVYVRAAVGDKYRPPAGVRIRTQVPQTQPVVDKAVAAGVDYAYRLVAVGANGTTSESGWVDVLSVTTSSTGLDPVEPTVTPTV